MANKDRKASDILSALARLSDAPDPIAGRDTVSGTVRVFHGADSSRRLNVDVVRSDISGADRCILLSAGGNKILLRLRCTGAFVVSFGEAIFEAADRTAGAGFVDEISRWLATPLVPAAQLPNRSEPAILLQGSYAELGAFVDGDGAQWRRFKICVDGGANAVGDGSDGHVGEFFLALCDDNRRAWLSEKWSRYRVPLLRAFDNALGGRREILNRKTIVVVGGGAWFSTPSQWILSPDKKHTLVTDELTSCTFEASCLPLPRLASGQPTLRGRLETVLKKTDQAERIADIVAIDRGATDAVWIEQPHLVDDNRGGSQREARVRLLFAANNHLTVVTTFTFRPQDARWAVAEWGRIVNSLTLTEPTAA